MTTPVILADNEAVDPFATKATEIKATSLKPGHVLMDPELGTPAAMIDHRIPATRGAGTVAYLVNDLDRGGWTKIEIHANKSVSVLAR